MTKRSVSGTACRRQAGKKPIQVWVTPEQWEILAQAAQADGRSVAQLVLHNALMAAMKIIQKNV